MQNKDQNDLLSWLGLADTPDWKAARALGPLLSITISLLFVLALFSALAITSQTLFGWPTSNSPTSLGAGTLIVALLGAPFLVWNTVIKQKTVDFQKESHITDRISKAVEQLGAEKTVKKDGKEETVPNIEVRIGGLLSLERIAQDSTRYDKGRDHVRVMEILCAYVRENSNATPPHISLREQYERETTPAHNEDTPLTDDEFMDDHGIPPTSDLRDYVSVTALTNWAKNLPKPRVDIQQALDVLGRRDAAQRQVEARWGKDAAPDALWVFDTPRPSLFDEASDAPLGTEALAAIKTALDTWQTHIHTYKGYRLDLRHANLQRADLYAANLSEARLNNTKLEGADLALAQLVDTRLFAAKLSGADLTGANVQGSFLSGSCLSGANFNDTKVEASFFNSARLEGVELSEKQLMNPSLFTALLQTQNAP